MPYQTVVLVFQVQAKEPKTKTSKIEFQTKTQGTSDFTFSYNYQVIEGSINLMPTTIRYSPSFPGLL